MNSYSIRNEIKNRLRGEMMGILLAGVCAIAYSLNYIFIQLGMRKSPKDNGSFISLLICVLTVLFIYCLMLFFGQRENTPFSMFGLFFYVLAGFFTAFLGRSLLFSGIRKIGSSRAVALKNSAPIFTIIVAILLLEEKISFIAGIGIMSILSALFLQAKYDFDKLQTQNVEGEKLGFILSIVAAMCFGVGQVFRKLGVIHYADAILGSLIGSFFALIVYILVEMSRKQLKITLYRNFQSINIYFIAAGIVTGIAQVSFFVSLLYTKVSYTSTIAAIEPIITVILARAVLAKEENIGLRMVITAFAVFLGTVIIIIGQ
jgi:drug/metabolite transporter (DMT)-like permease